MCMMKTPRRKNVHWREFQGLGGYLKLQFHLADKKLCLVNYCFIGIISAESLDRNIFFSYPPYHTLKYLDQ